MFSAEFRPILLVFDLWISNKTCLLVQTTWSKTLTSSVEGVIEFSFSVEYRLRANWYMVICSGVHLLLVLWIFRKATSDILDIKQLLKARAEVASNNNNNNNVYFIQNLKLRVFIMIMRLYNKKKKVTRVQWYHFQKDWPTLRVNFQRF